MFGAGSRKKPQRNMREISPSAVYKPGIIDRIHKDSRASENACAHADMKIDEPK